MIEFIKNVIKSQEMCVLATSAEGLPHTSLMAYVADVEVQHMYMITHRNTKKFENLEINPLVSLLIDTRSVETGESREKIVALTVSGECFLVEEDGEILGIKEAFCNRHKHLEQFANYDDAAVFKVQIKSFQLQKGAMDSYYLQLA